MTTQTSTIVYLNPKTEAEREALHDILAPHSWAAGEFGLLLTDAAFKECVRHLSARTKTSVRNFLRKALVDVDKEGVGDVCLNFGVIG
ncbi:MAG: hypothetical protein M3Y82_03130 [Verrucomicrobiota bacterium]|nr:hypothetical protein [Verrucomicrobiota bacterium]